ncbi:MAG: hypothetical protein AAF399_07090, partial [Bacteroidota bacterium]
MNISFQASPFLLLIIVPLAAGLSWWMYRGTSELLGRFPRLMLTAFRFVVFTILGLLLLQPLINSQERLSFAPIVAVLQDNSESLIIQKDSNFVKEAYPDLLNNFLAAFDEEAYDVDLYGYANEVDADLQPDSLYFDQTGTNISSALKSVRDLYQSQNLGAIVLISDGIPTAGVNPLYTVEGTRQPIFTVLLGDTTSQQDVRIKEVLFNDISYLNNEMPVRVKIQSEGFQQAPLKVSISNRQKTLATENLRLGQNLPEGEVSFLIKPDEVGLQEYTVSVSRLENEITYRNNFRKIYVNVLETRVKIGLFAGGPHPDLGALKQAFSRDASYEVQEFILKSPGVFYEDPGRYNLKDFDLLMLHNFPQSNMDQATVAQLTELIKEEKIPMMFFGGISTDLRTLSPLYPYLAITPRNLSTQSEEILLNVNRKYRQHSTFTFPDNWITWANSAPPLYRNQSNWQAKSTAEVFATAKIKNIPLDYPVFALQSQLGRKNMTFLGENFWRMRAHSYVESGDFEQFDAWLFNLIKWLMVADDKRKFKVAPSKKVFTGNEAVLFRGQAYDDSYNPVSGVEINLKVRNPEGTINEYYLNET